MSGKLVDKEIGRLCQRVAILNCSGIGQAELLFELPLFGRLYNPAVPPVGNIDPARLCRRARKDGCRIARRCIPIGNVKGVCLARAELAYRPIRVEQIDAVADRHTHHASQVCFRL
jgi:hypothetical protein